MASSQDASGAAPLSRTAQIKVMSPSPQLVTSLLFELPYDSTIRELKDRITQSVASKPDHSTQRIIYRGRILQDANTIGSILGASANGENPEGSISDAVTFHLALRPTGAASPPLPPPATTGTTTTTTTTTLGEGSSGGSLSYAEQQQQLRQAYQSVRERLERISDLRAEIAGVGRAGPPVVTPHTISPRRAAARPLGGEPAAAPTTPASYPQVARTTITRQTTTTSTTRVFSSASHRPINSPTASDRIPLQPGFSTGSPMTSLRSPPSFIQNLSTYPDQGADLNALINSLQSPNPPSQMYLLQGPEGQRVLLAAPPATTATPLHSLQRDLLRTLAVHRLLPGETIDSQPSAYSDEIPSLLGITQEDLNRIFDPQNLGLGSLQQLVEDTTLTPRPTNTQPNFGGPINDNGLRYRGAPPQPQPQPHQQQQAQAQAQAQVQAQVQQPPPVPQQGNARPAGRPNQDGLAHFWLAVRLAVFVFIFAQGGTWRRRVLMGGLAMTIFIWQTGLLNEQFAAARTLYREIFPPTQPNNLAPHARTNPAQAAQTIPPTPEATARLLMQRDAERRQTRFRDAMGIVERSLGLFLASLIPGMHERHVQALGERERGRLGPVEPGNVEGVDGGQQDQGQQQQQQQQQQQEPQQIDDVAGGLMMM
ncbi:hypothetical protein DFH27DRAFT_522026 [Peziza echinospora]|nr:hypothetical protein DFH27DRAFT_522026 [Peziza echinospora]